MKRLLSFFIVCILSSVYAFAYDWTDDNGVTWTWSTYNYTDDDGQRVTGAQLSGMTGNTADVVIPDYVYNGETAYPVVSLGWSPNLFWKRQDIESVKFPSTLKSMFDSTSWLYSEGTMVGVFAYCPNLRTVDFNGYAFKVGGIAFMGCSKLANILNADNITSIGFASFNDCSSLTSISFPSVTSIGRVGLFGCSSLSYVSLPAVNFIGNQAFESCPNMSSLRIGSVEQWCGVNFEGESSSPMYRPSKPINLYVGDSEIPASIIEAPEHVTMIPDYAFQYTTIEGISASGVTSIGEKAFYGCFSLKSFDFPMALSIGNNAFAGCESLQEAILPKVETIGSYAFERVSTTEEGKTTWHKCTALTTLSLPSVISIGTWAFRDCSNISSLRIGSFEQWCDVTWPSSDSYLAHPLYQTSKSVDLYIGDSETPTTHLEVPTTVTKIPDYAFCNTKIIDVSAPSVNSIGGAAFSNCTSLVSLELPAATSVGSSAFNNCISLPSAALPAATSIGSSAFAACKYLTKINLPKVETIGSNAFGYADLYENGNHTERRCCSSLSSVSFPSATSIGRDAFCGCTSLTSVSIPAATSIGGNTFNGCSSLTSISIPAVISIGSGAFYGCYNINTIRIDSAEQWCNVSFDGNNANPLTSTSKKNLYINDSETPDEPVTEITIPETVLQIPEKAFYNTDIHTIHFAGSNPPALTSTNAFPSWTMLAVPEESYETYLAADGYKTIPLQITIDGHITKEVEMMADATTSKLLMKVGEDEISKIVNLKIAGSINSYDMLIIRNQMTSLRNLDLSEASIEDCDYIYSNTGGVNYHSQKDVVTGEWLSGVLNVKLPATTKSIASKAFYNCNKLLSVEIPEGVTSIGSQAFAYCSRINNLTLPQSVVSFGSEAFSGCTGLKEVVIPDGVTSVGSSAFKYCTDLEKVTIPASVTSIGSSAFNVSNPLELHISSIEDWLNVEMYSYSRSDYLPFRNVAKLYTGESDDPVEEIIIPEGTTELKNSTFAGFTCIKNITLPETLNTIGGSTFFGCSGLTAITLPDNVTSIGYYAFQNCTGLTEIKLPERLSVIKDYTFSGCTNLEKVGFTDGITSIGQYAFEKCSKLTKVDIPAYLKTIGSYAFDYCTGLTEICLPASLTTVNDYAFRGCTNLNTVIATTVEPIAINQNTFSTYKTATVYSPKTSYYKYYWNTQWNQFLARKEYDKNFEYKYFYLNGQNGDNREDFEISDETGTIHGVDGSAPDADLYEGAGLVVSGSQVQELGDVHIHHNGNNGASIITKQEGQVHIDNLYVDIKTQKNRWYFFTFPFDVKLSDVAFTGSYVWYSYDGETRAANGNGGWKKVAGDVMKAGNGYIFQGAGNGTLTIHVSDVTIDASDSKTNMIAYRSDNKNDASWNLIGNANLAYYDLDNLGYEAPVTVYNNETGKYEAVRAGDDDYEFYPFQAFFVQKPNNADTMDFDGAKKETKNNADAKKAKQDEARSGAPKKANTDRKVINLELASAEMDADDAATDRTRIVVNPAKSESYETDCDAAKFLSDGMPQIYSCDAEGCNYAINERPMASGIVPLVVKAPKTGTYTISATRLDCNAKLRDLETGDEIDLAEGEYTFLADAKTYTNRFELLLTHGIVTSITTLEDAVAALSVENGAISVNDANAEVTIYTAGGVLVASQKGVGSVSVPAGVYVVNVGGQTIKVTVNE